MQYLIARMKERNTWLALIALATALGAKLSPDLQDAIVMIGVSLASGLVAATPEPKGT